MSHPLLSPAPPANRSVLVLLLLLIAFSQSRAQVDFEAEPISYSSSTPTDAVHALKLAIEAGEAKLEWSEQHGWLPSVLARLEVPIDSQTLVFSKTSLQIRRISPSRPRALYFNDDIYVGWVQGGDFVELAAVDSKQGAMFYKMAQDPDSPHILRDRGECLACHATRRTESVPGFLVRSVFPLASGQPEFRLGTTTTDHTTPLSQRFGGWYVTGHHGSIRHRGNALLPAGESDLNTEQYANQLTLPERFDHAAYLTDTSDIVALMVLEHQSQMHNRITSCSYRTRRAMYQQRSMNRILEQPDDYISDSTGRRIDSAVADLLEYLFFQDEAELESPIKGSQAFIRRFEAMGPDDDRGRSLRQFDLNRRLFKYPCSFLIYSSAIDELPRIARDRLFARMRDILNGRDEQLGSHLSAEDRSNILEILQATHVAFKADGKREGTAP